MEPTSSTRRLSAILMADVVGYSRLMGQDEERTVATLRAYREVFTGYIPKFNGRVVDAKGDAIMAEFGTVTDAIACAAEIQREIAERNEGLAENRRMQFRIGINLGEVLVHDDEIYGDGVNIAARLETLAEPGGICVSRAAHDQAVGKLPLQYEYLGEHSVKNIVTPVRVYRVLSQPGAAAHRVARAGRLGERKGKIIGFVGAAAIVAAFIAVGVYYMQPPEEPVDTAGSEEGPALPDGPSIAVLPFINMSGDPEQEYFADGLTDTLITDLSKLRNLYVAARNNVFAYKGKSVEIQRLAAQLGVRYVLEGGIQKVGDHLRINAQLIDGATGDHLWADRYDRPVADLFAVQDEIAQKIVTELNVKLVEGEYARLYESPTGNARAKNLVLQGLYANRTYTREGFGQAEQLLKLALEMDPENLAAIVVLGFVYINVAILESGDTVGARFEQALALAERAMALDPNFSLAYTLRGEYMFLHERNAEKGYADLRRAVALNPNDTSSLAVLAWFLAYNPGSAEEALELIEKAMRLNPVPPDWMYGFLGGAQRAVGDHSAAIRNLLECTDRLPDFIVCRYELLLAYMDAGQEEEAREQAREMLRIHPGYSVEEHPYPNWIPHPQQRERHKSYLRRAGLK